jgi:hypothetical protein
LGKGVRWLGGGSHQRGTAAKVFPPRVYENPMQPRLPGKSGSAPSVS